MNIYLHTVAECHSSMSDLGFCLSIAVPLFFCLRFTILFIYFFPSFSLPFLILLCSTGARYLLVNSVQSPSHFIGERFHNIALKKEGNKRRRRRRHRTPSIDKEEGTTKERIIICIAKQKSYIDEIGRVKGLFSVHCIGGVVVVIESHSYFGC